MSAVDDIAAYLAYLKTGGNSIDQIIFDELPNGEEMNATDELRRLLDERGVEHYDGTERTLWGHEQTGENTGIYRFAASEISGGFLQFDMFRLTPEQAVEATLGRGTCRIEYGPSAVFRNETGPDWTTQDFVARCSECGHRMHQDPFTGEWPRYCPWCGAKVVDA